MVNSKESQIQEDEYRFPYHYIPVSLKYPQHFRVWSWSYRYIAGLELVISKICDQTFESVLDFGCGDGRLLNILHDIYGNRKKYMGVDISGKALAFAKAFNFDSSIVFTNEDITTNNIKEKYDLITSVEVIEHIHPDMLENVIDQITLLLKINGKLILSCPHINKKLNPKHFQHFSKSAIEKLLGDNYRINFHYFDKKARWFTIFYSIIYANPVILITSKYINGLMYWVYKRFMFQCKDEKKCERMLIIAEKIR